jgi:hypothetical protein
MKHKMLMLIYGSDLLATRFLLGVAELVWALALFWPGDTFGRPTYSIMSQLASEHTWALLFLITGILQFKILFDHDYHSRVAIVFSGWNCNLWMFTVIAMYLSVYPPPAAISGELACALGSIWVFVRSGVPAIKFRNPLECSSRGSDHAIS